MSQETKNAEASAMKLSPELIAHLCSKLEDAGMSAEYIRELALVATATVTESGSIVEGDGLSKHSNVVSFESRSTNKEKLAADAKETAKGPTEGSAIGSTRLMEAAASLAIFQALGNPIDDFDWNLPTSLKQVKPTGHDLVSEIDPQMRATAQPAKF